MYICEIVCREKLRSYVQMKVRLPPSIAFVCAHVCV